MKIVKIIEKPKQYYALQYTGDNWHEIKKFCLNKIPTTKIEAIEQGDYVVRIENNMVTVLNKDTVDNMYEKVLVKLSDMEELN